MTDLEKRDEGGRERCGSEGGREKPALLRLSPIELGRRPLEEISESRRYQLRADQQAPKRTHPQISDISCATIRRGGTAEIELTRSSPPSFRRKHQRPASNPPLRLNRSGYTAPVKISF